MNLIILAAGYGSRLSPATESTPKALLKINGEETLLDKQLEAAKICGIKEVCIVAGFQVEKIENKIKERADLGLHISLIYNPFFKSYNNLVSLWTASSSFMMNDFIMLNGDNIIKPSILNALKLESEKLKNNILVAINKKSVFDEDDTKVKLDSNKIIAISKEIPFNEVDAEWIGMCAVCGESLKKFRDKINEIIRIPGMLDGSPHYLSVFQGIIDDGNSLDTMEILTNSWSEVDYIADLEYVRNHITRFND